MEALILECNLIKEKKPKYNINLKDNKSYPFIKVTVNEPFPRVFKTRTFKRDGGRYFGPYPNVGLVYRNLKLIQQLFPIRSCDLELPSKRTLEPCLDYFIKRCDGCCIDKITPESYREYIDQVILFLSGKYSKLLKYLTGEMAQASKELRFEVAARFKSQIEAVKGIHEIQRVYSTEDIDLDVMGLYQGDRVIGLTLLFIREGKLLGKRFFIIKEKEIVKNFSPETVMGDALKNYYSDHHEIPGEIILPVEPLEKDLLQKYLSRLKGSRVKITVPKVGRKIDWVQLASQNARFGYLEEQRMTEKELVLTELKKVLKLTAEPRRIEGFDIANILGQHSVAAMVSFKDGIADKKSYRHFKIKSVEGPNDVGSLKEVVGRRYQKLINESLALPDLILIDGGKGQVNGAKEVLDALNLSIPVIGLAKREEEIFYPKNPDPLVLPRNSVALRLLQEVRDEAHRFGNSFHRKLRDKSMIHSQLDEVKGVGKVRRKALLKHFKTIDDIKKASVEELCQVDKVDQPTAEKVYGYFHPKDSR
ncbi:MAG TPA: excinuclease ABC subunit UvrC, partial [Spirochaetes bacterium]|nr:excinuclease ABC subunit UvrC [Spirochaetota bacterium]